MRVRPGQRGLTLIEVIVVLAVLAVLLACIGLYGLIAVNVTRRTGEIGIRMALGATRWQIAWPVLREAWLLSAAGVLAGGLGAQAASRIIRASLYGVKPNDPFTLVLAALVLLLVSALAAWLPARRAARIEPVTALKAE